MPRSAGKHPIELPNYLWEVLDATAAAKNVTTTQLIASWLTEAAWSHADDVYEDPATGERLRELPRVDGRYTYPRREPRSSLAAQIVAEGSPSPTLAALQRRALESTDKG